LTPSDKPVDVYGNPWPTLNDAGGDPSAPPKGDEAETVALLKDLARGGPALELGIGGGRIALPLAAEGIRVDGIDSSPEMVAQLRSRPRGADFSVTMGDFVDVDVDGRYRLVYVVANSFMNLATQERQVRCLENVARHLTDDGVFLAELLVPWSLGLQDDQYVRAESVRVDQVRLDVLRHDGATQTLYENHVWLSAQGVRLSPVITRYVWPSELDLMARLAGLRLKDRWSGWKREPFDSKSRRFIAVYRR
jgi:SAM-dependent methyltransferase